MNFFLIINELNNNNEVIYSYSINSTKEINTNKLFSKGNYHIWIYLPQPQQELIDKSSFKIVFNKNILIDFNKFDTDFNYIQFVSKEIALLKEQKKKFKQTGEFDIISGYNIIEGFFIHCIKNRINDNYKLDYTIEKTGDMKMITKGFETISNDKFFISDTIKPNETKIYLMMKKGNGISIKYNYTTLKSSKGKNNTVINKDMSYYNFSSLTESNKSLNEGIKFMIFNTPQHKKTQMKIYEILNLYDDDNLIKGLNIDRENKNR
jgi:hypothetical protein